jgi:3-oxoacyl-[acyl-carrier-protein] synthase-3
MDLKQGCPGWIIGISSLAALVSTGQIKRAILMNGDINTRNSSPYDKESQPLFSDAGAVTALEYDANAAPLEIYVATRGKDYPSILCPAGGARQPVTENSLIFRDYSDGSRCRDIDCRMDGMSVFSFGISAVPKAVKKLWEHFEIDPESIDKYFFHQANLFMNEKIRKKLKIDETKVPYILRDFGNSSSASIPENIVVSCNEKFNNQKMNCIGCSFGVGLQYGAIHFVTDQIVCPELINY